MFDLEHSMAEKEESCGGVMGLDLLRGVLVSAAKVSFALLAYGVFTLPNTETNKGSDE